MHRLATFNRLLIWPWQLFNERVCWQEEGSCLDKGPCGFGGQLRLFSERKHTDTSR